jgi:phage replication-related protein YjqB (UPF0714/DUF867 family)
MTTVSYDTIRTSGLICMDMETYRQYNALRQTYRPGEDYVVLTREGADTRLAVMAPHGGGIEPGTVDIADAIAGNDFTFYAFKGIRRSGNRVLHLASDDFDEPEGVAVAEKARVVVTVHGCRGSEPAVLIGGRHEPLKEAILGVLSRAGFRAAISGQTGLRGASRENICNRFAPGGGVQMELTRGLREAMFDHLENRPLKVKTALFYRFVSAVRQPLLEHFSGLQGEGS